MDTSAARVATGGANGDGHEEDKEGGAAAAADAAAIVATARSTDAGEEGGAAVSIGAASLERQGDTAGEEAPHAGLPSLPSHVRDDLAFKLSVLIRWCNVLDLHFEADCEERAKESEESPYLKQMSNFPPQMSYIVNDIANVLLGGNLAAKLQCVGRKKANDLFSKLSQAHTAAQRMSFESLHEGRREQLDEMCPSLANYNLGSLSGSGSTETYLPEGSTEGEGSVTTPNNLERGSNEDLANAANMRLEIEQIYDGLNNLADDESKTPSVFFEERSLTPALRASRGRRRGRAERPCRRRRRRPSSEPSSFSSQSRSLSPSPSPGRGGNLDSRCWDERGAVTTDCSGEESVDSECSWREEGSLTLVLPPRAAAAQRPSRGRRRGRAERPCRHPRRPSSAASLFSRRLRSPSPSSSPGRGCNRDRRGRRRPRPNERIAASRQNTHEVRKTLEELDASETDSNAPGASGQRAAPAPVEQREQRRALLNSLDIGENESNVAPSQNGGGPEQHSEADKGSMTLLEECRSSIRDVAARLSMERIAVVNIRLVQVIIELLQDAFDARNPRLSRVFPITKSLAAMIRTIARHKSAIATYRNALRSTEDVQDTLIDFGDVNAVGSMLSQIDANKEKKKSLESIIVSDDARNVLLTLKSAMRAQKQNQDANSNSDKPQSDKEDTTDNHSSEITSADIAEMSKKFNFDQAVENLIGQCLNLTLFLRVATKVTLGQLQLESDNLVSAKNLWERLQPGVAFEATAVSLLQFHEVVLLPALAMGDSKTIAVNLICCTIRALTDTRLGDKRESILPLWEAAQSMTIDGNAASCEVDYCAGRSRDKGGTRSAIASIYVCLILRHEIPKRLPGAFRNEFTRTMVTNSRSYTRKACNFQSKIIDTPRQKASFFFDSENHGEDSYWGKKIRKGLTHRQVGKQSIILNEGLAEDLLQLLSCNGDH